MQLCLDERLFPAGSLLAPSLAPFQGPALYAYNDGIFSEKVPWSDRGCILIPHLCHCQHFWLMVTQGEECSDL